MDALKKIAEGSVKETTPEFRIGDTVRVSVNIREGERERIQMFEGTVIARRGSGVAETFTVRRLSYGVGVERVFPLHSPRILKVELVRPGKVRRSKIYYVRDKIGKAAKIKELLGPKANKQIAANKAAVAKADAKEVEVKAEVKAELAAQAAAGAKK